MDVAIFDVLNKMTNMSWFCENCIRCIPRVQKLLIRVGNVEAKYEDLEERVHKIEDEKISKDDVKTVVKEELLEQKEVEKRKLNVMCFNIPESKNESIPDRQNEDKNFLMKLFETKMNNPLDIEEITKRVRLGARKYD